MHTLRGIVLVGMVQTLKRCAIYNPVVPAELKKAAVQFTYDNLVRGVAGCKLPGMAYRTPLRYPTLPLPVSSVPLPGDARWWGFMTFMVTRTQILRLLVTTSSAIFILLLRKKRSASQPQVL